MRVDEDMVYDLGQKWIKSAFGRFGRDEAGAITVDWIVLTALLVMMAMGAGFALTAGVPSLADSLSEYMDEASMLPG